MRTDSQHVQEDATHVVAMSLVVVVDMTMVMEVWRMSGGVVCFEMLVVSELIAWCHRRHRHRALHLQACMRGMDGKVCRRLNLDLERLVAGLET